MRSTIVKRSIVLRGHKTSVSLEDAFWQGLRDIATAQNKSLSALVEEIDAGRANTNLSSHIRLFVLSFFSGRRNAPSQAKPEPTESPLEMHC